MLMKGASGDTVPAMRRDAWLARRIEDFSDEPKGFPTSARYATGWQMDVAQARALLAAYRQLARRKNSLPGTVSPPVSPFSLDTGWMND